MLKLVLPMLLIFMTAVFAEAQQNDDITVYIKIEGFKSEDGLCSLLLFEGKKGFPDSSKNAVLWLSGSVQKKSAEFSFKIRRGIYAIAALHDENSNGKMDKTWYGKPLEGFGSSNNPKVGSGPPGFEESSASIDENNNHFNIKLNYF
jgi:uncharacterized protein (DUF2141 family)